MPLQRRIPKFGFTNPNRVEYKAINLDTLIVLSQKCSSNVIVLDTFISNGLAGKRDLIKVLGRGELTVALEVQAHSFSVTAKAAIENAGGKVLAV